MARLAFNINEDKHQHRITKLQDYKNEKDSRLVFAPAVHKYNPLAQFDYKIYPFIKDANQFSYFDEPNV